MTALSVVCLIMKYAIVDYEPWAVGIAFGLVGLLLLLVAYSTAFLFAWLLAEVIGLTRRRDGGDSPFATDRLPTQLIPPNQSNDV